MLPFANSQSARAATFPPQAEVRNHSEHYRALREVHEPLLKSIETITGKRAEFIQWNLTGPAQPREKPPG